MKSPFPLQPSQVPLEEEVKVNSQFFLVTGRQLTGKNIYKWIIFKSALEKGNTGHSTYKIFWHYPVSGPRHNWNGQTGQTESVKKASGRIKS